MGMTLHVYTIRPLVSMCAKMSRGLQITLNGDRFVVPGVAEPLTVSDLLSRLDIDARRVAVEHNLIVLKRAAFADTLVRDGDQVEIVNFVGGG
jgi:thiamine biosynthesis protein ThiS